MKNKSRRSNALLVVPALLLGIGIMLYPFVSGYLMERNQSRVVESYQASAGGLSGREIQRGNESADEFNRLLFRQNGETFGSYGSLEERYWNELNLDGIMGYIRIPSIGVSLPIVHGTSDEKMSSACGHVEGSSLPVGGESTHTVLSGHRGLPSAKLFTDLDQMAPGDCFYIHVMEKTCAYRVDSILVVRPDDVKSLGIAAGKDCATLVTCTPYGINTHRLLVRGERIPYEEKTKIAEETEKPRNRFSGAAFLAWCMIAGGAVVILLMILLIPVFAKIEMQKKVSKSA